MHITGDRVSVKDAIIMHFILIKGII